MYLAIDLGDKRCGVAVYLEAIIVPKGIVPRPKLVSVLRKMVKEYGIETIVVGLPYDLYNKKLRQLEKTQDFIGKLTQIFSDIKVVGHDERFTSFEADMALKMMNVKDTQGQKDDISAVCILESYLKKHI